MIIPRRFNFQNFTDVIKKDFVEGEFEDIGKKYFDRAGAILENEVHLYHYNIYLAVNLNKMDNVVTTDVQDRKSTRLNSSHVAISYAVFCLKKNKYIIYI